MFRLLNSIGARCFYATRTHLPKLRFSYTENINIQACERALEGFIFESRFPHDTFFNAFVLVLSFALSICPAAGQDFQNTPCPAALEFS